MMQKTQKLYVSFAVMTLNFFVCFMLFNVILWLTGNSIAPQLQEEMIPTKTNLRVNIPFWWSEERVELYETIYPGMSLKEILALLLETWNQPTYMCDKYGLHTEPPGMGTYVNIDQNGFRRFAGQAAWPPPEGVTTIFVFGGSTTFGYGVADNDTIPAVLQNQLTEALPDERIAVYNFGRGFFYSSWERTLYEGLIHDGFVPDVAIFIDGLNDFWHADHPLKRDCDGNWSIAERLSMTMSCKRGEICLPVQRVPSLASPQAAPQPTEVPLQPLDDDGVNRLVVDRWLENKAAIEAIAEQHHIDILFVMQPVPAYAYDLAFHPYFSEDELEPTNLTDRHLRGRWGYAVWNDVCSDQDCGGNVLNLTRLSEDIEMPLYVDRVHYSAPFIKTITTEITRFYLETLSAD